MGNFIRGLFTLFVIVFPPFLAVNMIVQPLVRTAESQDWASTTGEVLKVETKKSRGGQLVHTDVIYAFSHNDRSHRGDWIDFWPGTHRGEADQRVSVEGEVTVWFDPANPSKAVLDRTIDWKTLLIGLIPLGLCWYSGLLAYGFYCRLVKGEK